jgi:hypothetical protein
MEDGTVKCKNHISELINILKREIQSFNIIVELLILEEKALVECDNKLLLKVLERQGDVFSSIACLEKSRVDVIAKIAEQTGKPAQELTISTLLEFIDEPLKKELVETGHVLSRINDDIKQKKMTNTMLIKQGIMAVESNIRFILRSIGKEDMIRDLYSRHADTNYVSGSIRVDGRL